MQGTEQFKEVILNYLENRSQSDIQFQEKYINPEKNIDQCIQFIFSEVKKSGKNGFADDEVFGMAVHYYDEKELKIDKVSDVSVIVNQATDEQVKPEVKKVEPKAKKTKPAPIVPFVQLDLF